MSQSNIKTFDEYNENDYLSQTEQNYAGGLKSDRFRQIVSNFIYARGLYEKVASHVATNQDKYPFFLGWAISQFLATDKLDKLEHLNEKQNASLYLYEEAKNSKDLAERMIKDNYKILVDKKDDVDLQEMLNGPEVHGNSMEDKLKSVRKSVEGILNTVKLNPTDIVADCGFMLQTDVPGPRAMSALKDMPSTDVYCEIINKKLDDSIGSNSINELNVLKNSIREIYENMMTMYSETFINDSNAPNRLTNRYKNISNRESEIEKKYFYAKHLLGKLNDFENGLRKLSPDTKIEEVSKIRNSLLNFSFSMSNEAVRFHSANKPITKQQEIDLFRKFFPDQTINDLSNQQKTKLINTIEQLDVAIYKKIEQLLNENKKPLQKLKSNSHEQRQQMVVNILLASDMYNIANVNDGPNIYGDRIENIFSIPNYNKHNPNDRINKLLENKDLFSKHPWLSYFASQQVNIKPYIDYLNNAYKPLARTKQQQIGNEITLFDDYSKFPDKDYARKMLDFHAQIRQNIKIPNQLVYALDAYSMTNGQTIPARDVLSTILSDDTVKNLILQNTDSKLFDSVKAKVENKEPLSVEELNTLKKKLQETTKLAKAIDECVDKLLNCDLAALIPAIKKILESDMSASDKIKSYSHISFQLDGYNRNKLPQHDTAFVNFLIDFSNDKNLNFKSYDDFATKLAEETNKKVNETSKSH